MIEKPLSIKTRENYVKHRKLIDIATEVQLV